MFEAKTTHVLCRGRLLLLNGGAKRIIVAISLGRGKKRARNKTCHACLVYIITYAHDINSHNMRMNVRRDARVREIKNRCKCCTHFLIGGSKWNYNFVHYRGIVVVVFFCINNIMGVNRQRSTTRAAVLGGNYRPSSKHTRTYVYYIIYYTYFSLFVTIARAACIPTWPWDDDQTTDDSICRRLSTPLQLL